MEYSFRNIEREWQKKWKESDAYKVSNDSPKPKFYVLDMFPYPSGAGLHVGHPLGYIASDIYARYKRLKGFNVLHPMGYDSFGLPAEQYALETGQHPAVTTEKNINTFRSQLDNIGFSFDWSREVRTSDPKYYKWTQWIFLQLFNSYFCNTEQKALPISKLIKKYETKGAMPKTGEPILGKHFTAEQWNAFSAKEKEDILMNRRLAYIAYGEVNWCEALGTVLANDEVLNGVSERGGYPVVKKKMRQWYLRITAYAERLVQGLETVDFSDAMKEMQRNWIGKSEGAEIEFKIKAPSQPSPAGKESQPTEPVHYTADPSIYGITKQLSIEKRNNPTPEESLLWNRLNANQIGFHIRRQHIIGSFIVDFVCIDKMVTIEVDGGYHNDLEQKKYDESRTEYLNEKGFREIRFTNSDVRNNIDDVISRIKKELESQRSHTGLKQTEAAKVSPEGGDLEGALLRVYTTRPDTIFGVDFMVLAPEHELVQQITTDEQKEEVEKYLTYVKSRSDRERMAEVKQITGAFTGAYAINPISGREIPVWISEYVLAGYGTGAIMGVPCGDQRDFNFARHFNIPITNIIGEHFNNEEANATKEATLTNSDFLDGMLMKDAIGVVINKLEELGIGKRKINYKMRDAGFSRQRYWGEPFPIIYKDGIAYPLDEKDLPVELPHVENYKPGPEGEGPLANIPEWVNLENGVKRETNTMPGYAGSSWYFLRYADPHNDAAFADRTATDYWNQVDVYVGGTEHAVGHLLYSRMWTKVLFDLGLISFDEPFKKLVNQGMIGAFSFYADAFVYRWESQDKPIAEQAPVITSFNTEVNFMPESILKSDGKLFKRTNEKNKVQIKNVGDYVDASGRLYKRQLERLKGNDSFVKREHDYVLAYIWSKDEDGEEYFDLRPETEKMSKSRYNVVNPDEIIEKYGADTFRMYEMFLGPVEQSKPWDTKGIEGVHRFLKKLWRLFFDDLKGKVWTEEEATDAELKVLHKTIKKIEEDTERFSYNTAVSAFMVCVNELHDLKCYKKEVLEQLLILLTPYAPHISEELWHQLGNTTTILDATFPSFDAKYLIESAKEYPISVNGKMRTTINISLDASQEEVEKIVLQNDVIKKWVDDKPPKKIIYVKNKMVNVVV